MKNIYKQFRNVEQLANRYTLSKRFDEPTYFSFRLKFGDNGDQTYNIASNKALFDTMPHPLFYGVTSNNISNPGLNGAIGSQPQTIISELESYSAIQYLIDANEPTRARMLMEFIEKFNDLQENFPYYFQSIDGISELIKTDPKKGQRLSNESKISITCLEALDLRMSYLLNLYKKIVWDDVYQRWVLPDMMRYFTLKIYLSEFRTFHIPQQSPEGKNTGLGVYPGAGTESTASNGGTSNISTNPLYLSVLDDILPTWEITCEMCEFDITDISFEHLNGLSVATDPQMGAVKFGIKIGNIKELQIYPMFTSKFLIDRKLNGLNRAKDEISTYGNVDTNYLYPTYLQIAQTRENETSESQHLSGMPYNERRNTNNVNEADIAQERIPGSTLDVNTNATDPETWVGNALDFGTSYAKNFVNKIVDKAKMTNIPGLGVSFNEVKTAIESKNIITAFGLIRKGINEVVQSYGNSPSSRLEQPVQTDKIMIAFLTELTKSEATDNDTKLLKGAAGQILNDKGIWEKIKDLSLATNLVGVGTGEININKTIQPTTLTGGVSNLKIQESAISIVDSNAASGSINEENKTNISASSMLSNNINIDDLNKLAASSQLNSKTQPAPINQGIASEKLSSRTQPTGIKNTESNIRTTEINITKIIEAPPTSTLNKIQAVELSQGEISKATNNKLQK